MSGTLAVDFVGVLNFVVIVFVVNRLDIGSVFYK
jgi:hypothetical protein